MWAPDRYYRIPDNVVLHGLKQRNGKFIVRIFGVNDNPKENRLFGRDLDELEDTLGVRFWEGNGQAHSIINVIRFINIGSKQRKLC